MDIGDLVINKNDLRLRGNRDNRKYAIVTDVYKIISIEEDNQEYVVIDINTNRTMYANKDCLVKVY